MFVCKFKKLFGLPRRTGTRTVPVNHFAMYKLLQPILPLGLFAVLFTSCTVESADPGTPEVPASDTTLVLTTPNNLNTIFHADFDKTLDGANPSVVLWIDSAAGTGLKFVTGTSAVASVFQCEILDSAGFGYPDALLYGKEISSLSAKWKKTPAVLGTDIGHAGHFEGAGDRFLGFRFANSTGAYHYGWVQLNCHSGNDLLKIEDFAFNQAPDAAIAAGQTDSGIPVVIDQPALVHLNGPDEVLGFYRTTPDPDGAVCTFQIKASTDPAYDFTVQYFSFLWPAPAISGRILDGRLVIPYLSWEGNVPSPGGNERLYASNFAGSGVLLHEPDTAIIWNLHYTKTGFMADQYIGEYKVYKCQ